MTTIRSKRAFTVLEMLIAATIFVVFASNFSQIWISTNKQVKYVLDRAKIGREAYTARTFLAVDFAQATQATIEMPDESFTLLRVDGSSATYTLQNKALVRFDTVNSASTTVAAYVNSMATAINIGAVKEFTTSYGFQKSSATLTMQTEWEFGIPKNYYDQTGKKL